MKQVFWSITALISLAAICGVAESRTIAKREAAHPHIDPHVEEFMANTINREKRKVEVVTGVKNAVLGFVFNKINSFIDHKTHLVEQLDKTNIAKNAAHHIVPPADPVVSLSGIISGVIGQKLQAAGPILSIVTNKLGAASSSGAHKGFNFGALVSGGAGHGGHGSAV